MHLSSMPPSPTSAILLLDVVEAIMGCRKYESEPIVWALLALGTVLLLPGKCGMEVKRVAKEQNVGSMVEQAVDGHGDMAKAVTCDILSLLS